MSFIPGLVLGGLMTCGIAATPQASGSIVINGETFALSHGRAWQTGHVMGMPTLDIMLAEKPLANVAWWTGSENFAGGRHGVVLRFKPAFGPDEKPEQTVYRYVIAEDYEVNVFAGGFGNWSERALTKDRIAISEFSVSEGVVSGKLKWNGTLEDMFNPENNITSWSATFALPLEEVGTMPGK
ncbi:MAG: hypothetical protein ABI650_11715 [Dokdonella sp.]